MDFSEVNDDVHSFCVLRHDIEFSIDRALEMARIEHEDLNVHSTYTVQLRTTLTMPYHKRTLRVSKK